MKSASTCVIFPAGLGRLLCLFVFFFSSSSFASFPVSTNLTFNQSRYDAGAEYCRVLKPANVVNFSWNNPYASGGYLSCYEVSGAFYAQSIPWVVPNICPPNSNLLGSICTCGSGFSDSVGGYGCSPTPKKPSPIGAKAPSANYLSDLNSALAIGLAAAAAIATSVVLAPVVPLLAATALASGGLLAYVGSAVSMHQAGTAQATVDSGSGPLIVRLTPLPYSASATPMSSVVPSVDTSPTGGFLPSGGGQYSGSVAIGGWSQTGADWLYYSPGIVQPTASITKDGFQYQQTSVVNGQSTSEVVQRYSDDSLVITKAAQIAVTTSAGQPTSSTVASTQSYSPLGGSITTTPFYSVGANLGNGSSSNSGVGLSPTASAGSAAGGVVKIDESGTVGAVGSGTAGISSALDQLDGVLPNITTASGEEYSVNWVPVWLTNKGCSAYPVMFFPAKMNMAPITIDLCPLLPLIYQLMNVLWVAWTLALVSQMAFKVTTQQ